MQPHLDVKLPVKRMPPETHGFVADFDDALARQSSKLRGDNGNRMYSISARRMT